MPRARKHLVDRSETPYYHVVSRCVRRAFLCGVDHYSGKSYEHRRDWIEDRIRILSSLFGIELCAYAVMSNHYHLVVKLTPEADDWSDDDVLDRWTSLFRGPLLVQRYMAGDRLQDAELASVRSLATVYRQRLASLSWFMKCLNEPIARRANKEDGCSGHFWEARFYSQGLRSKQAIVAAMAYVDLNPIRAGIAETPESSPYTSASCRLKPTAQTSQVTKAVRTLLDTGVLRHFNVNVRPLSEFAHDVGIASSEPSALLIRESEYLKLLDVTGRVLTRGKQGRIDPMLAPILDRLCLSSNEWVAASTTFKLHFRNGQLRFRPAV